MGLNSYRIALILRIVSLLIVMLIFSLLVTHSRWLFSSIISGILLVILIIDFFRVSFKYSNDIEILIKSLEENGTSLKIRTVKHLSKYKEVEDSFDRIRKVIQNARIEKEVQYNFLQILIENIPSGIITLNSNSKLLHINHAAKEILEVGDNIQWSQLQSKYPVFTNIIQSNTASKNELISIGNSESIQISYAITSIKLLNDTLKVVNFQNIKSVLDKNEMQAWNNLIRTMTHEIMNSITPIISLSETGLNILNGNHANDNPLLFTEKNLEHLNKSLSSINNKSVWLKEFVDNYRKLIRIPEPVKKDENLSTIIDNCVDSLSKILINENIKVQVILKDVIVNIDKNLIEQVVNNVIKNSVEALKNRDEDKKIEIRIEEANGSKSILIIDNGEGVKTENQTKIFVPFFTTKQEGSGIGLSLSRQIMRMHDGTITFESEPWVNTTFRLQFK